LIEGNKVPMANVPNSGNEPSSLEKKEKVESIGDVLNPNILDENNMIDMDE